MVLAAESGPAFDPARARRGAVLVRWGFEHYRSRFRRITRRSARRFEDADWPGMRADMAERLALYSGIVRRVVSALAEVFDGGRLDEALWIAMKREFSRLTAGHADVELAETFFNSVTRKVFPTVGVRPEREFVHFGAGDEGRAGAAPVRTFPGGADGAPTAAVLRQLLADYAFGIPWADAAGDAALAARELDAAAAGAWGAPGFDYIETLDPVFFRNKGAYVVGRVVRGEAALPLVLAFLNPDGRVRLDAALASENEASIVFSYTRSYFHVDVENPAGTIRWLHELMPRKPLAELYNAIGFDRHGKTVLYRELRRHVERSGERFEVAPGERGLVMVVFTMPGFDVVFKVLRDRFGPGKTVTPERVRDRYRFVAGHDRAGRLVDVQEFELLEFPRGRFAPELLDELLGEAAGEVTANGDQVVLRHVYTERRVTPLNLWLAASDPERATATVLDLGQALRDLAATDIFPGDLLVKNFGVTRHGRVVFYDYDELSNLAECEFRWMPDADDTDGEPTFYAGPRDIFPEELIRFIGLPRALRDLFAAAHAELLAPDFWNAMKRRHRSGEVPDLFPYREDRRLRSPA